MDLRIAKRIARQELKDRKLTGWTFKWDNAKKRLGLCNFKKKTITMSKHLTRLNDEAQFKNTLLHEIAHAIVGVKHGHDSTWRSMAQQIGSSGERCAGPSHVRMPKGKYIYHCPNCKRTVHYHRRIKNERACGSCCNKYSGGRFDAQYIFIKGEYKGEQNDES